MRVLVIANDKKATLLEDAFKPVSGVYQRVSPAKLKEEIFYRLKPDVMVVDISDEDALGNDIVMMGVDGQNYVTVFTEIDDQTSPAALRKSVIREVKDANPDLEFKVESPENQISSVSSNTTPIWMIGASSGGPGVLMDLFSKAKPGKAAVIVALHIDKSGYNNYVELLSEAAKSNGWRIKKSSNKPSLTPGDVLLIHPDDEVSLDGNGKVSIQPAEDDSKFYPLINKVIKNVSECVSDFGAIILTGIGTDGASGIAKYKSRISSIVAQDDSAPLSSMPEACRRAGGISKSIDQIATLINGSPRTQ